MCMASSLPQLFCVAAPAALKPCLTAGWSKASTHVPTLSCLALLPLFLAAFICFSYLSAALFTCRQGCQALGNL